MILVDWPEFNLRLAKKLKRDGHRVFYYISPQVWAWRSYRVRQIKRDVEQMLVILPFEKEFYEHFDKEYCFSDEVKNDFLGRINDLKVKEKLILLIQSHEEGKLSAVNPVEEITKEKTRHPLGCRVKLGGKEGLEPSTPGL